VRGLTNRSQESLQKKPNIDMSALPNHRLQAGPIIRTVVNTAKDDNQWTLQETDAISVDFCNFR
jgi:hypothetical protein